VKILHVVTRADNVGGAQTHLLELAGAQKAAGHDVLVAVGGEGPFLSLLEQRGIVYRPVRSLVREIRPLADARALFELRAIAARFRPDLLCAHTAKAGILTRIAAATLRLPVVLTAHGWTFNAQVPALRRWVYNALEGLVAPMSSHIITVSRADADLARRRLPISKLRISTVHNGISAALGEHPATCDAQPPLLIMVARFEDQKDHATLLTALSFIGDLPWRLDLVGDGPLMDARIRQARSLRIDSRIRFLGARSDVPRLLAQAQLFVLATRWEGLPISILEAMRAGLPVVASNAGGVAEIVVHDETGLVVPPRDPPALATALRHLIADPARRAAMGVLGQARFLERFQFSSMYEKTMGIYRRVLEEHRHIPAVP
jgi:glycosyltransferase involved in cell wall biosynthesis